MDPLVDRELSHKEQVHKNCELNKITFSPSLHLFFSLKHKKKACIFTTFVLLNPPREGRGGSTAIILNVVTFLWLTPLITQCQRSYQGFEDKSLFFFFLSNHPC